MGLKSRLCPMLAAARPVAFAMLLGAFAAPALAATHSWDLAEAPRAAERDFRAGHIQFYWCGTRGVSAPGVPMSFALRYPQLDGGEGCIVENQQLRARQADYSARYNKRMLAILQNHR